MLALVHLKKENKEINYVNGPVTRILVVGLVTSGTKIFKKKAENYGQIL